MSEPDWTAFQRGAGARRVTAPPPPPPEPFPAAAPPTEPPAGQADEPRTATADRPATRDAPAGRTSKSGRRTTAADRRRAGAPAADSQDRREPAPVWLPYAVRDRVRSEAAARQLSQTELFVLALNATHQRLRRVAKQPDEDRGALLRRAPRRRRYRVEGGTQLGLYLTGPELEVVDKLADDLGYSRSELATEVFQAYLDPQRTEPGARASRRRSPA